jgi:hypothetical protein
VVDGVPKLIMISVAVGGDRLPCSVSYCILASGPEGWSLVSAEHIGSAEDLHDCLVLFSARARNSLDSELWRSGDVDVVQQIPQSSHEDRGFISKSFDLVGVVECLILLGVAPRSVVFIFFAFSLIALFFFLLVVFFLPMIVGVVVVLWQLWLFCRCSLRFLSLKCHDHNLEWFLLLRRVVLWLLLRWHIPWRQLTNWQTSSSLAGCVVRMNHLKIGNRRE